MKKAKKEVEKISREHQEDTIVGEISYINYRIFQIKEDGCFVEPKDAYGSYIFDHYSGYPSVDDAKNAIVEYRKSLKFGYETEYIVLPIITVRTI